MYLVKKLILITVVFAFLSSCKGPDYNEIFDENKTEFKEKKKKFVKLIKLIKHRYLSSWRQLENFHLPKEKYPDDIKEFMNELGIGSLSIQNVDKLNCKVDFSIVFEIEDGWNIEELRVVKIFYDPCNDRTLKNQHYYDGYHIDIWGLGDGWGILSDTDFI